MSKNLQAEKYFLLEKSIPYFNNYFKTDIEDLGGKFDAIRVYVHMYYVYVCSAAAATATKCTICFALGHD